MSNTPLYRTLAVILFVCGNAPFFAQTAPTVEVGILTGIANYLGDLQQSYFELRTVRPAVGGYAKVHCNHQLSVRLHALRGELWASDANYPDLMVQHRAMKFHSDLRELGFQFEFAPMHFGADELRRAAPYLTVGLNRFEALPIRDASTATAAVDLPTAPRPVRDWSLPFGLGFHFLPHPRVNVGFEANWRKTFTDQLDHYAPAGTATDWYFTGTVQVGYRFGKVEKRRSAVLTGS